MYYIFVERFKPIPKSKINDLPKSTGVYCFLDKKEIIYIGKAVNMQNRVKNHFNGKYWWEKTLLRQGFAGRVGFIETNSEIEALILEASLIKKYQPKFNVVWRDDKNYFYVAIAKNDQKIPYIFITHRPSYIQSVRSDTLYVGPFVEGIALKKTLRFLRRVFPYYTSAKHPKNKCTWCHLGLCPGPRLFEARLASSKDEAANLISEYRKNIRKLILILKGKRNTVLNALKREMADLSKKNEFEKAAEVRDRISNLQQVMAHTKVISDEQLVMSNRVGQMSGVGATLAKIIGINKTISRIECYDVSNIQGKSATGSMVVFIDDKPYKNFYRKFHMKIEAKPNDIAMLKETLQRRFAHPEWEYPEIILIDGGMAQLNLATKTKNKNPKTKDIKVISIAKRNKDLYIEGRKGFIPLKSLPREIFNLILQLDDEAHRFAIAYHKKLRRNELLK